MKQISAESLEWLRVNSFDEEGHKVQVFTFVANEGDEPIHLDVSALRKAMIAGIVHGIQTFVGLTDELYQHVLTCNGVEEEHLKDYSLDKAAFEPMLILVDHAGEKMIADGNHGLVKAYRLGLRKKPAYYVSQAQWENYLLDPPDEVADLFISGAVDDHLRKIAESRP